MKQTLRIFMLILLVLTLSLAVVACSCGEQPDPTPDDSSTPGNGGDGPDDGGEDTPPAKKDKVDLTSAKLQDKHVTEQPGVYHESNAMWGAPRRSTVWYEYYDQNGNLLSSSKDDDPVNGVKDQGVYTIKAWVSLSGYEDNYIEAKLYIYEANTITYACDRNGWENPKQVTGISKADPVTTIAIPSCDGYKFIGWKLGNDYITEIDPKSDVFKQEGTDVLKDVTITAIFSPYMAYPTPYKADDAVTDRPTTLPAIPGYSEMQNDVANGDAFLLYDMNNIHTNADDADTLNMQFYSLGVEKNVYFPLYFTPTTEGGETVYEWFDFNDLANAAFLEKFPTDGMDLIVDSYMTGDSYFNPVISCKPIAGNYAKYNTVEFWVYSARATGHTFGFTFWGEQDADTARQSITLDFVGWKKFSMSYESFARYQNGSVEGMKSFRILASSQTYGNNDTSLNLATSSQENYIYFSNIYLTAQPNSYSINIGGIPDAALLDVMSNYAKNQTAYTESELSALVNKVDGLLEDIPDLSANPTEIWGHDLTTKTGINAIYADLLDVARLWNCPDSDYYGNTDDIKVSIEDDSLLLVLQEILGYLYENDYFGKTVAKNARFNTASYSDYREACVALTEIAMTVGNYINHSHAAWMAPVVALCPSGSHGDYADKAETATVAASAYLVMGNKYNFISNIRHILSLLENANLTNHVDANAIRLLSALIGTDYQPTGECANNLYLYFLRAIDMVTYEGEIANTQHTAFYEMAVRYTMLADLFNEEQQNDLLAIYKTYLSNSAIKTQLEANVSFASEQEFLDKAAAHSGTRSKEELAYANQFYGIYKSDDLYFYMDKTGHIVLHGATIDETVTTNNHFDIMAYGDVLAVSTDNHAILVHNGNVTVKAGALAVKENDMSAFITVPGDNEGDSYFASSDACLMISLVEDGSESFKVSTGGKTTLTLMMSKNRDYDDTTESTSEATITINGTSTSVELNLKDGWADVIFSIITL